MTKMIINAATGRMGRELIKAGIFDNAVEIYAALARSSNNAVGMDIGTFAGESEQGVFIGSHFPSDVSSCVAIDFSLPEPSMEFLRQARIHNVPVVVGTTGFSHEQLAEIDDIAQDIPLVMAANFSIGVNLLLQLVQQTAKTLGESADIEIFEAHHKHKLDAPSGTALALGDAVAKGRNTKLEAIANYDRASVKAARKQGELGFSVVRAGEIVGDHEVMFALNGEVLSLKHHAQSRQCFAQGAIRAAKWLVGQSAGLYSMQDVLA